ADHFGQTKNTNLEDAYAPSGGWSHNSTPPTLIISSPALTDDRRSDNRQPVYINSVGCDAAVIEENDVLHNNIIYFVQDSTLYKRVLSAPESMNLCGTPHMDQTCPAANATSTCQ